MCEWRDISTAPKDGSQFDALCVNEAGQVFRVPNCKWGKEECSNVEHVLEFRPDPSEPYSMTWQLLEDPPFVRVTHWMLPPEPPK